MTILPNKSKKSSKSDRLNSVQQRFVYFSNTIKYAAYSLVLLPIET